MLRLAVAAAVLAALTVATVPAAAQVDWLPAHELELHVLPPPVVVVGTTPTPLEVGWSVTCAATTGPVDAGERPMQVSLAHDGATHFELRTEQVTVAFPDCATVYSTNGTARLELVAGPQEVGGTRWTLRIVGSVQVARGTLEAAIEVTAKVAWRGGLEATAETQHLSGGPQEALSFPVRLTNLGNAPAIVHFALAGPAPPGWQAILPNPVVLDTPGTAGAQVEVAFVVSTPYGNGPNNDAATFTIDAWTTDTDEGVQSNATSVTVEAYSQGFYLPGPTMPVLLAGLAALGLAARRARRR